MRCHIFHVWFDIFKGNILASVFFVIKKKFLFHVKKISLPNIIGRLIIQDIVPYVGVIQMRFMDKYATYLHSKLSNLMNNRN